MEINAVSFMANHAQHAAKGKGSKKAVVGAVITAGALAGAYVLGKKSPKAADFADSGVVKKIAQTVAEGFKSIPDYARKLVAVIQEKIKLEKLADEAEDFIDEAEEVVDKAL